MKSLIDTATRKTERVFLVGVELKDRTRFDVQDSLAELDELAKTAGGEVIGNGVQKLEKPAAATFIDTTVISATCTTTNRPVLCTAFQNRSSRQVAVSR